MTRSRLLVAAVWLALASCAGTAHEDPLRGLPPRHDPAFDLTDDDDLARARGDFDAIAIGAPERGAHRRELVSAYLAKIAEAENARDEAFRRFQQALGLWDARELADDKTAPPDLELLAPEAEKRFKQASTTGLDVQAITALSVLAAAHPEKRAEYDKTWKDIVAYTNELAVAAAGPGAERSRAIEALETSMASFPSRWSADRLVELYLARQASLVKAIAAGTRADVLGAHRDPGVVRPVWNLVRAFARTHRLGDAVAVVDPLAGQFGDEPELRKRLHAALDAKAAGSDVIALMAAFLPSHDGDSGDGGAALAICEDGAAHLPTQVEPKKCAAEIARVTDHAALAIRWGEDARRVAPDDHDVGEILARLYIVRMADLLQAERVDAAKRRMQEIETFYADAAQRWADKPLDVTLADAYLAYGRGLYNLGEVDGGVAALERAEKLAPSPAITEELATVALKTGKYADAEKGFVDAALKPRSTPIDTAFDGNRLRRLAGEAAQLSGANARATTYWKRSASEWTEILSASLNPRAKAQALTEVGRVYDDLGENDKSLQAMAAALDADPEQIGVYGDVISFLTARSHYDEARDAYHRALGRPEITEYLKVYSSLWIVDLGRVAKRETDPLAVDYLGQVSRGGKWYQKLARFKLGQLSYDELLARADTRGKRAEAYYYEAMERYARGDRGGAERLLGDVVATQMLGFFEYEMARYYLRHGPPGAPAGKAAASN
jgi:tetratricopeptide (TPR) repeat protein